MYSLSNKHSDPRGNTSSLAFGDVIRRATFSSFDAEFTERLWLLGITLILIMASGENLLETGARLKTVKSKKHSEQTLEYWSPNYLGRVYQATSETGDAEWHQRAHWRKGHIKSQPYGPRQIFAQNHLDPTISHGKSK